MTYTELVVLRIKIEEFRIVHVIHIRSFYTHELLETINEK